MALSEHSDAQCDLRRSNVRPDSASEERRILNDVKNADAKLWGIRGCVSKDSGKGSDQGSGPGIHGRQQSVLEKCPDKRTDLVQQASGVSALAEVASIPSSQGCVTSPRVSSMVKRVVEATGHGLEQLLGQENSIGPAPVWTTSSLAVRPTSR